jgi:hypothetical protein
MDKQHVNNSDMTYQDRWRCLQSVDDLVEKLHETLEAKQQWNNTYFIYRCGTYIYLTRLRISWCTLCVPLYILSVYLWPALQ